ncbi:MAG: tetratricopeptide repeat protein [Deltaproteobacteria bacterium]|nr:tetratricopeptide repeat protein [Deltaproteobacteria bacterium]
MSGKPIALCVTLLLASACTPIWQERIQRLDSARMSGELASARQQADSLLADAKKELEPGEPWMLAAMVAVAETDLLAENDARGENLAAKAQSGLKANEDAEPVFRARAALLAAEVALLKGQPAAAESALAKARTVMLGGERDAALELRAKRIEGQIAIDRGEPGRAAEILTAAAGGDVCATPALGVALADAQVEAGELSKAAESFKRLDDCLKSAPSLLRAEALVARAELARQRDELTRAGELLGEARDIWDKALGEQRLPSALMSNLAVVQAEQGEKDAAAGLLRKAIQQNRAGGALRLRSLSDAFLNLGGVLLRSGAFEEAETAFQEALSSRQALFGEQHPESARARAALAAALLSQGKGTEACEILQASIGLLEASVGPNDSHTMDARASLAAAHAKAGDLKRASLDYQELLSTMGSALDAKSRERRVDVLLAFGDVLERLGRESDASRRYAEALAVARDAFGEDDPKTVKVIIRTARVEQGIGEGDRAKARLVGAIKALRAAGHGDHLAVAECMLLLGRIDTQKRRYEDALKYLTDARKRLESARRKPARTMADTYEAIASVYRIQGRDDEAGDLEKKARAYRAAANRIPARVELVYH